MHECVYAFICDNACFTMFMHPSENGHLKVLAVVLLLQEGSTRRQHHLRPCSCLWQLDPSKSSAPVGVQCARACLIIFPLILPPTDRYLKCDAGDA